MLWYNATKYYTAQTPKIIHYNHSSVIRIHYNRFTVLCTLPPIQVCKGSLYSKHAFTQGTTYLNLSETSALCHFTQVYRAHNVPVKTSLLVKTPATPCQIHKTLKQQEKSCSYRLIKLWRLAHVLPVPCHGKPLIGLSERVHLAGPVKLAESAAFKAVPG